LNAKERERERGSGRWRGIEIFDHKQKFEDAKIQCECEGSA